MRRPVCFRGAFLVVSAIYIVLCTIDVVSFTIWPSVKEYLGELDPYRYFAKSWEEIFLAPWGVRTAIAMPALLLPEVVSLTVDQAFGLYCGLLLMGTVLLINRAAVIGCGTRIQDHEFFVTLVIYGLGYFMNGRLCPAFLGSAMLLYAHVCWFRGLASTGRAMFLNLLGLPLLTVSSGTFMVGFVTILVWSTFAFFDFRLNNYRFRPRWRVLFYLLPILFIAGVQASLFLAKLNDYYDGDMTQVVYHGYGEILEKYLPGLTLGEFLAGACALTPVVVLLIVAMLGRLPWQRVYLVISVGLTLCMGACGWSTMFTNTPTIVLCGALYLSLFGQRIAARHLSLATARPIR